MTPDAAKVVSSLVMAYLLIGVSFAGVFVTRWAERLDPGVRGSTRGFRVMILPGSIILWPLLAMLLLARRAQ